jgi:hypothetical protein
VPADGGWDVYQIKKFDTNLKSGQKAQIKRSLKRLRDYAKVHDRKVVNWYLTLPLNQTPGNVEWFEDVVKDVEFSCEWRGLDFVEGLAGEYPSVVDYYLNDGKEQLRHALTDFAQQIQLVNHSVVKSDALDPAEAVGGLTAIHRTINRLDPHFRYDYEISGSPVVLSKDQPGLVFSSCEGAGDTYVTIKVFSRYDGATVDRPIPVNLRMSSSDVEVIESIQDFVKYGSPLRLPEEACEISADFPGGLGGEFSGTLWIKPGEVSENDTGVTRLRVVDRTGSELAVVKLQLLERSLGLDGSGMWVLAAEINGVFTVEMRIDLETRNVQIKFTTSEWSGRSPVKLIPGLTFLENLNSSNYLQFGAEYGPFSPQMVDIPGDLEEMSPVLILQFAENLARIQECTPVQIRMPDLNTLNYGQLDEVDRAARLLKGETIEATTKSIYAAWNGNPVPDAPQQFAIFSPHNVQIGEDSVTIGIVRIACSPVILTVEPERVNEPRSLTISPVEEEKLLLKLDLVQSGPIDTQG